VEIATFTTISGGTSPFTIVTTDPHSGQGLTDCYYKWPLFEWVKPIVLFILQTFTGIDADGLLNLRT